MEESTEPRTKQFEVQGVTAKDAPGHRMEREQTGLQFTQSTCAPLHWNTLYTFPLHLEEYFNNRP